MARSVSLHSLFIFELLDRLSSRRQRKVIPLVPDQPGLRLTELHHAVAAPALLHQEEEGLQ